MKLKNFIPTMLATIVILFISIPTNATPNKVAVSKAEVKSTWVIPEVKPRQKAVVPVISKDAAVKKDSYDILAAIKAKENKAKMQAFTSVTAKKKDVTNAIKGKINKANDTGLIIIFKEDMRVSQSYGLVKPAI